MHMLLDNLGAITDWRTGETWTAEQIRTHAAGLAAEFARRGIGRGCRVVTWHGGDGRFFADLFAIWQAGACAIALNASPPPWNRRPLRRSPFSPKPLHPAWGAANSTITR
jgi:acyl-CoA synthetase (AMP-forming)/AMP-acid ligase II